MVIPSTEDIFSNAYAASLCSCSAILSKPISFKKSIAAPRPIAPAMIGVPASNFQGSSFHVDSVNEQNQSFLHQIQLAPCFQQMLFSIKYTNTCRTAHFMSGKSKEITI